MSELCCSLCNKVFAKANSLSKHKKRSHPEKPREKFACFYCDYKTVYKFNLNKHMNKVHLREDGAVIEKRISSQPYKVCSLCNTFACADRGKMINHYMDSHNVPINKKILNFNSFEEFLSWKRDTESQEYCRFVAGQSRKIRLKKHVWMFRCFRDGHYMPRGKGQRSLKVKGSVKIGSVCPCSMKVTKTLETGTVCVVYVTPHVGHNPDVSRLTLTKEEREYIASKISEGVPDDELLASLRDSMSFVELSRLHLTTRKDLWNIKNSARIQKKSERRNSKKRQLVNNIQNTPQAGDHSTYAEVNGASIKTTLKSPGERYEYAENSPALIDTIQETPEAGLTYADMKLALINNIQMKPNAVIPRSGENKPAFINNIQKKPKEGGLLQYGEMKLGLTNYIQKKPVADDRSKYEEMKRTLLDNISSLIDRTTNCAQLEVIQEAFLPLSAAIKALESNLSSIHMKTPNYTKQPIEAVDEGHLAGGVLSEDVVSQTLYAQDDADSRNTFQNFYE